MSLTRAEEAFVERCRADDGWYVPGQARMVRRLVGCGLLLDTTETRYNTLRGSRERRATLAEDRCPKDGAA